MIDIRDEPFYRKAGTICPRNVRVSPAFYRDNSHQRRLLENITKRLLSGGVDPSDIVLLSHFKTARSVLQDLEMIAGLNLRSYEDVENSQPRKVLRHTTISKFKGLESKVILKNLIFAGSGRKC